MKPSYIWFAVIGAAIAGAGAGFWLGVRAGANVGLMVDSAPRGAIALYHLQAIAAGQTKNTVIALESDIDTALLWNYRLEEERLSPFVETIMGFNTDANRKYLTRLADYRRGHPSPLGPEAVAKSEPQAEKDREFRSWLVEGARQNQAIISQMVERYASKSP